MTERNTNCRGGGIGIGPIFIVLKLCGVIDWSWWWVLSPYWIGFLLVVLLSAIVAAVE